MQLMDGAPTRLETLRIGGRELLDSTTLERLCLIAERLERKGERLVVLCDDEPVLRLLHAAGFAQRFELRASTTAA
jgi:anti-anti-sigma regulatory factor